jgi:hypothetical protein
MSDEDINKTHIGGVIVSVLVSSAIDRLGQSKDCKIGICCFSTQYTVFKDKEQRLVVSESRQCVHGVNRLPTQTLVLVS